MDALLNESRVQAVIIAAPPDRHANLTRQALQAGRHVFCEKPLALSDSDADAIGAAVKATRLTLVIDHVLRYNPILVALCRLREEGLLDAVRRFAFENDAADEDLPAGHWFWDEAISGGILLEHGVHFFDAAAMLIQAPAHQVQAIGARRPDGRTDTVVCTVVHTSGAMASHAHAFTHPHRAERQLMRLDYGAAEARVHGWIPLHADLDAWTDEPAADAFEQLPDRIAQLLDVPGVRPTGQEQITVTIDRDAAPGTAHPHHVIVHIRLDGPDGKERVYRECVRAALLDLAICARTGATPRADFNAARAAVHVAAAGSRALHDGHTHVLPSDEAPCP